MTLIIADVGLPMIFIEWPFMLAAFIPVVVVECFVMRQSLGLSCKEGIKGSTLANALTTLFGIPAAWLLMVALLFITTGGRPIGTDSPLQILGKLTIQSAWLAPHEYEGQRFWIIPAVTTALLIPSFFVSVILERWVLFRLWRTLDRKQISTAVLKANCYSYFLLIVIGCVWLLQNLP